MHARHRDENIILSCAWYHSTLSTFTYPGQCDGCQMEGMMYLFPHLSLHAEYPIRAQHQLAYSMLQRLLFVANKASIIEILHL